MKFCKVRNPCKICLRSVSKKNGLQCQGACKKWAHYECLNYTPGKISDIKAKTIKITCPCPECGIPELKGVLPNNPRINKKSPATNSPHVESSDGPAKQKPIPHFDPSFLNSLDSPEHDDQLPPECTSLISQKSYSKDGTLSTNPTPPGHDSWPEAPSSPACRLSSPAAKLASLLEKTASSLRKRDSHLKNRACPSCPLHCPKRYPLNDVPGDLSSPQRSLSSSMIPTKSSGISWTHNPRSSSFSGLSNGQDQDMLLKTIEQMCDTVGQLSKQLKDLICKAMNAFENIKSNK